ncbi:MAG: amidohydrolase [Zavarzinella sp.]
MKRIHLFITFLLLVCGIRAGLGNEPAEVIYHGGEVLTIDDRNPSTEAVAIRNGRIVEVGKFADVVKHKGEKTAMIDLQGHCMLPGFVDGHGHCYNTGIQAVCANLLAPPDHTIRDIRKLQDELKKWSSTETSKKYKLIVGFGYDDAQLKEQRHPTRQDLDAVSTELPVIAIHQSGHLCALNTKALQLAEITKTSKNPTGGIIRREKDGETPDGVLEETAFMAALLKLMPRIGDKESDAIAVAGMKIYAANGYTMAQEGRSMESIDKSWIRLAEGKNMLIDVISYPDLSFTDSPFGIDSKWHTSKLINGYRIGGVKLSLDGSPQGKTAYLSQPYLIPPHGKPSNYRGYPAMPVEEANKKISLCYQKGWQFLVHCNGDAAADMMLGAVKDAQKKFPDWKKRRDVMIHCQTVREDQLDLMKELGIIPSLFGMHCFYWGDWHRDSVLGAERAERISPARSALKRGMIFSQHHDAPVALPNAIRILSSVVTRRTRSGDILGASQCISVENALKSLTLWAAYHHFEEANRGSIEVGKLADFVILDKNPHKVPILYLSELKVLETIKEGKTIFKAQ